MTITLKETTKTDKNWVSVPLPKSKKVQDLSKEFLELSAKLREVKEQLNDECITAATKAKAFTVPKDCEITFGFNYLSSGKLGVTATKRKAKKASTSGMPQMNW